MGKKKQKTTTQNTYSYQKPPDTADISALRNQINSAYDTPDSGIGYSFGKARQRVENRFGSPFGADYSPEVREAIKYNDISELDAAQGAAYNQDAMQRRMAKTGALSGLAGLTAPQLVQTGGTQTSVQSGGMLGQIIGAGAGLGQAALM